MTPADLVNQTRYFPELFANLYHTGEMSGKLDEV
jgi:type II secretory pathway component PulF